MGNKKRKKSKFVNNNERPIRLTRSKYHTSADDQTIDELGDQKDSVSTSTPADRANDEVRSSTRKVSSKCTQSIALEREGAESPSSDDCPIGSLLLKSAKQAANQVDGTADDPAHPSTSKAAAKDKRSVAAQPIRSSRPKSNQVAKEADTACPSTSKSANY